MVRLLSERNILIQVGDSVEETLFRLARKHRVPGAQLAICHGGETVAAEVGELRHGSGLPVTPHTAFPVGSITKCFTATVSMILVADGDLELDTPLAEYLSELDELGDRLTLRQVLSHTSGLGSGPDSERVLGVSVRRYILDHCRPHNLVLPPGTGFSYSNMGYALAGLLIEKITGMSWRDAVESILLRPLGIEPTFLSPPGLEGGRLIATGHSVNTAVGRTRPVQQSTAVAEAPAGGLAVSAADLVALGLMHVGQGVPELLPAVYAEQMRQADPAADPFGLADGWGLGLALFREATADWVGHDGNGDGTSCHLRINPADGWVVALTTNAITGYGLWQELLAELAHANVPIGGPRAWGSPGTPTAPPAGCVGTYVNGDVEFVVAAREDGHIYLAVDGDRFARLTFHDGLTFWEQDPDSGRQVFGGRFVRDPVTGRFLCIQIGGRCARRLSPSQRDNRLIA